MKVKEESEKLGLKLNIQKTKIMASCPITSWQIDRETVECQTLFWGAPKSLQMVIAAMNHMSKHSVQFSRSVVSDSLQPHELQHTRPPSPSPSP